MGNATKWEMRLSGKTTNHLGKVNTSRTYNCNLLDILIQDINTPCLEKTCLKDVSAKSNTNLSVQLHVVSHWHLSRLFYEFSRTSVVRIFMCRKLVAKWSRRFQICFNLLCAFFRQYNMSKDCRAIVWLQSNDVRASVANMSLRNFGEFTM